MSELSGKAVEATTCMKTVRTSLSTPEKYEANQNMKNLFDDFPREKGGWFPWTKAIEWRRNYEVEILEAMKAADNLKILRARWIERRGCSGDCEACDTTDWCLFTIQREEAKR